MPPLDITAAGVDLMRRRTRMFSVREGNKRGRADRIWEGHTANLHDDVALYENKMRSARMDGKKTGWNRSFMLENQSPHLPHWMVLSLLKVFRDDQRANFLACSLGALSLSCGLVYIRHLFWASVRHGTEPTQCWNVIGRRIKHLPNNNNCCICALARERFLHRWRCRLLKEEVDIWEKNRRYMRAFHK